MGYSQLDQLEREAVRIVARLRRLEELPVPAAAKMIKKPSRWVRAHFDVIVHGPRSHHVRVCDIEAYQHRRTVFAVQPLNGKEAV